MFYQIQFFFKKTTILEQDVRSIILEYLLVEKVFGQQKQQIKKGCSGLRCGQPRGYFQIALDEETKKKISRS